MKDKHVEMLKKLVADSSKRLESQLKLKVKDVLNRLLENNKNDNKRKES